MQQRRQFILSIVPAMAAVGSLPLQAQPAKVDEADPMAKGVAYRHDATKVDSATNPTYVKGRVCGSCQLYQGKAGDAWAPCPLVGGKQVSAAGWCSAWVKKAA